MVFSVTDLDFGGIWNIYVSSAVNVLTTRESRFHECPKGTSNIFMHEKLRNNILIWAYKGEGLSSKSIPARLL